MIDFLKQLRTIHFFLILYSVTLLVATKKMSSELADKALVEVREVNRMLYKYKPDILFEVADRMYKSQFPEIISNQNTSISLFNKGLNIGENQVAPIGDLEDRVFKLKISSDEDDSKEILGYISIPIKYDYNLRKKYCETLSGIHSPLSPTLKKPKTLVQFKAFWSVLHAGATLEVPSYIQRDIFFGKDSKTWRADGLDSENLEALDKSTTAFRVSYHQFSVADKNEINDESTFIYEYSDAVKYYVSKIKNDDFREQRFLVTTSRIDSPVIPCGVEVVKLDPISTINDKMGSSFKSVPFRMEFPNLYEFTQNLGNEDIDLVALEALLHSGSLSSEGSISVLGVEMPRSVLVWVGLPVIALIQLYFLIHFVRFTKAPFDDDEQKVLAKFPWIAIYRDSFPAKSLTVGTLLLPVITSVVVMYTSLGIFGITARWIMMIFPVLTLLIGILSINALISFWKPSTQPNSSAE